VHVLDVLADPTRREIIELLARQDMSASEVAERFILTRSAVSQHLQILRSSGLILMRRKGQRRIYSLNIAAFEEVEAWIAECRRIWRATHADASADLGEPADVHGSPQRPPVPGGRPGARGRTSPGSTLSGRGQDPGRGPADRWPSGSAG
jgi:DNA-binding transcriptional ArsR family regulator